jgi:hypothetical protein
LLSIATASSSWARCRTAADGKETLPELALSDEGREALHAAPSIGEIGRSILTTRVCRRTGSLPFEPRFMRCSKKRRPSDPIALLHRTEMDDGVLGVGPGQYGYEIARIGHSLLMR